MVRCSLKRTIRIVISLIVLRIFFQIIFSSTSSNSKRTERRRKSPSIVIVSSHSSKSIERLKLFLTELRLSHIQREQIDVLPEDRRSILVFDRFPNGNLSNQIRQHRINTLIYFDDRCDQCQTISYDQMLIENITYPTIDFHRDYLQPIIQTTSSPFRLESSNEFITILKFKKILPNFFGKFSSNRQCRGFNENQRKSWKTILYVRHKRTFEKIRLIIISKTSVLISSCLDSHWFIWPILMDTLKYLSSNRYDHNGFDRFIQVDIDDMFLGGKSNDHLNQDDIRALIRSQTFIEQFVPKFRYRLGFSAFYFNSSVEEDNRSDFLLIQEKHRFIWFHHTWRHDKLTSVNDKISLIASTKMNLDFADKYNLPIDRNYAVAPHHAGIYPINHLVFEVWHDLFNFTVTSTENYPYHYHSPSNRRGFVYRNISVLPRQSSALYTTMRYYRDYPGGSQHLEQFLMGGKLFRRILTNPISLFMSHNVNFGHDRLANYVFSKLIYLITTWTNFSFSSDCPTIELAKKYFHEYYPDEKLPVFTNPCDDQFLLDSWIGNRSLCQYFPRFIIIGPQKTGTTALHAMLSQHPHLHSSDKSSTTYEEVQFFSNDSLYLNGIEWYLNRFDLQDNSDSTRINFEKSATYFDSPLAMKRIKALLPRVLLIVILLEPGARAYSRYQHEVARRNISLNFDQLMLKNHSDDSEEFHLKQRCLRPGHYAEYLRQWFEYFPTKQIYIVDGDAFRQDPRPILDDLQRSFLQLENSIEASKLVRFNKKKGFFCPISNTHRFQCLGKSKGRVYEKMSSDTRDYLTRYYRSANEDLIKILQNNNYSLPIWLSDML